MVALFWHNHQRTVGPTSNLGDVKSAIEDVLRQLHFTDIRHNQLEVAGNKNGCVLSIGHFRFGERDFWEVTMCGGPDGPVTQGTRDEVVRELLKLTTVD
jgi:hypothetical protein